MVADAQVATGEKEDCMELEHVIGFTGHFPDTLKFRPAPEPQFIVYNIGAVVVVQDLADPHRQEFLQGHDAEICALDISYDGRLYKQLASQRATGVGQV